MYVPILPIFHYRQPPYPYRWNSYPSSRRLPAQAHANATPPCPRSSNACKPILRSRPREAAPTAQPLSAHPSRESRVEPWALSVGLGFVPPRVDESDISPTSHPCADCPTARLRIRESANPRTPLAKPGSNVKPKVFSNHSYRPRRGGHALFQRLSKISISNLRPR